MASQGPFQDTPAVIAKVKTLINAQLKSILKKEGLLVSGVKAAMQDRIISHINQYVIHRDTGGYFRLRTLIETADGSVLVSTKPPHFPQVTPSHPHQQQHPLSTSGVPVSGDAFSLAALSHSVPVFKESPFYSILEPLTSVAECKALVREATRDTFEVKITLKNDAAEKLSKDPSIKAMIYCASEPISPFSKVDISFPYQLEIKINGDDVKANLRGLKNKLGSTRPADITSLLRRRAGYENSMTVTYALTNRVSSSPFCSLLPPARPIALIIAGYERSKLTSSKKFYMVVNLVRRHAAEDLVTRLKAGKTISIDQVVGEMIKKGKDSDIVTTCSIMSLTCPLSIVRINVPCRSLVCAHNQCFDALSFLQLQEQAPTWQCPICSKSISFEALAVDQYVNDVLAKTPQDMEQVTIEPDGKWSQISEPDVTPNSSSNQTVSADDDELIEIRDMPRVVSVSNGYPHRTSNSPHNISREPPASSLIVPTGSSKRSHPIIDISSDEEGGEQRRGPKRQHQLSNACSPFALFQNGTLSGSRDLDGS